MRHKIKKLPLQDKPGPREELLALGFNSLLSLAEGGSEDAATLLSERLIDILARFLETCDKKPELFYAAAEKRSIWPGLITLEPRLRARYRHYDPDWIRKRVHLGECTGLKYEGKLAGSALGSRIARQLFDIIGIMRRTEPPVKVALPKKLPELAFEGSSGESRVEFTPKESTLLRAHSKRLPILNRSEESLAKWWRVMKPLFVKIYGCRFEDHKALAHYCEDVEKLSLTRKHGKKYAKEYQKRNEIRRRILKDVRQGLQSIAASSQRPKFLQNIVP
jgi:hypothetical protein